jgi:hypothetical protein
LGALLSGDDATPALAGLQLLACLSLSAHGQALMLDRCGRRVGG